MDHEVALTVLHQALMDNGAEYRQTMADMIDTRREEEEANYEPKRKVLADVVAALQERSDALYARNLSLAKSINALEDLQEAALNE